MITGWANTRPPGPGHEQREHRCGRAVPASCQKQARGRWPMRRLGLVPGGRELGRDRCFCFDLDRARPGRAIDRRSLD
jgi:hypothetical protein